MLQTLDTSKVEIFQSKIISWFASSGRIFPWRQTNDPFEILIAEIVLKLTGAWKAEQVYKYLIARFGTTERMANANLEELAKAFKPLGLHSRANLLVDIAKQLNSQFGGNVPETYAKLLSLKGVGQYTANAILCLAYGKRVPMVDGSISRVFSRHFNFCTDRAAYADKELWNLAERLLPKNNCREYNLGLLDLGAIVCKYRNPICPECPVVSTCTDFAERVKNSQEKTDVNV